MEHGQPRWVFENSAPLQSYCHILIIVTLIKDAQPTTDMPKTAQLPQPEDLSRIILGRGLKGVLAYPTVTVVREYSATDYRSCLKDREIRTCGYRNTSFTGNIFLLLCKVIITSLHC